MTKTKTYADTTLQRLLSAKGYQVQCMWEMPGPKNTAIAWLTAYAVNGTVLMVQTYEDGGWEAYLPCEQISVSETVETIVRRISK